MTGLHSTLGLVLWKCLVDNKDTSVNPHAKTPQIHSKSKEIHRPGERGGWGGGVRAPSLVPGILLSLAPGILTGCVGLEVGWGWGSSC